MTKWDAVIVGSGFGGAMVAHRLVDAGMRVLMIERGDWVPRGRAAWKAEASLELTPSYSKDVPYRCERGGHDKVIGGYACVGGPSVYYGCAAFRFRREDFVGDRDVVGESGAAWPFAYEDLEPHYAEVERLLQICGDVRENPFPARRGLELANDSECGRRDPTAPHRSTNYHATFPCDDRDLAPFSRRLRDVAVERGLQPFRIPLAINFQAGTRPACWECRTCDSYACAIAAKNDVATMMIEPLIARGMTLWTRTLALELEHGDGAVRRLHLVRKPLDPTQEAERITVDASRFIVAAGALGTPHLLLASQLDELAPNVGSHLMRHANAMVFGLFLRRPDPEEQYHKQIALHDWYFGDSGAADAAGLTKLGGIQQVMTPPKALVHAHAWLGLKTIASAATEQLTGLLCIAEDQPRETNRVRIDTAVRDAYGLPQLVIEHAYTERDRRARNVLVRRAKRLLRQTGAKLFHTHRVKTFSHAVGTVRMGRDPNTSPLDENCRFRGLANLWIADGSALPMSSGVNPSLTIAANALRVAEQIARDADATDRREVRTFG